MSNTKLILSKLFNWQGLIAGASGIITTIFALVEQEERYWVFLGYLIVFVFLGIVIFSQKEIDVGEEFPVLEQVSAFSKAIRIRAIIISFLLVVSIPVLLYLTNRRLRSEVFIFHYKNENIHGLSISDQVFDELVTGKEAIEVKLVENEIGNRSDLVEEQKDLNGNLIVWGKIIGRHKDSLSVISHYEIIYDFPNSVMDSIEDISSERRSVFHIRELLNLQLHQRITNDIKCIAQFCKGLTLYINEDYKSSLMLFKESQRSCSYLDIESEYCHLIMIGNCYYKIGRYNMASDSYYKAIHLKKKVDGLALFNYKMAEGKITFIPSSVEDIDLKISPSRSSPDSTFKPFSKVRDTGNLKNSAIHEYNGTLIRRFNDEKYGFLDTNGNTILPFIYDGVGEFSGGAAKLPQQTWNSLKWGFINRLGDTIVLPKFSKVGDFIEGITWYQKGSKKGLLAINGQELTPPEYDDLDIISANSARVRQGGRCGLIDRNGDIIVPISYSGIFDFHNGFAKVLQGNKVGLISDRKVIVEPRYEDLYNMSEGLIRMKKNGHFGFIDTTGKEVIPPIYSSAKDFSEGFAPISAGIWAGYLNKDGEKVIDFIFSETFNFKNGYAKVKFKELYGYINIYGKYVVKPNYESLGELNESHVSFLKFGKWGFVDIRGKVSVSPIYSTVSPFESGVSLVQKDGLFGAIDSSGMIIIPFNYHSGLVIERNTRLEFLKEGYPKDSIFIFNRDGTFLKKKSF